MKVVAIAPGGTCANGGSSVATGVDANGNGMLDPSEISGTSTICNGSNGAAGSDGHDSLIAVDAVAPGLLCAAGGKSIRSGQDGDGDGTLSLLETTSTALVCNGTAGANGAAGSHGANGANGANGNDGVNGVNGVDGLTTLTATVPVGAGPHCAAGGILISSGADLNGDGVLDPNEITSRSYVCNGLSGVGWIDVANTLTEQALPNTGYVADNAAQVVVTLPANAAVGDVLRVSGAGAGGWRIAQNANQSIVTSHLDMATISADYSFLSIFGTQAWQGVASSADGQRLVAAISNGPIITSADGGMTWGTSGAPSRSWGPVASSADGRRLLASGFGLPLYVSGDYGRTWQTSAFNARFTALASSADGRVLAAAALGSQLYLSTDFGANWSQVGPSQDGYSIAMSADGTHMIGGQDGGDIWLSWDGGANWSSSTSPACCVTWSSVASSADGNRLVAAANGGYVYTSEDGGNAWTQRTGGGPWIAVTSSADGSRLLAATRDDGFGTLSSGLLYSSSDAGTTWSSVGPGEQWVRSPRRPTAAAGWRSAAWTWATASPSRARRRIRP